MTDVAADVELVRSKIAKDFDVWTFRSDLT